MAPFLRLGRTLPNRGLGRVRPKAGPGYSGIGSREGGGYTPHPPRERRLPTLPFREVWGKSKSRVKLGVVWEGPGGHFWTSFSDVQKCLSRTLPTPRFARFRTFGEKGGNRKVAVTGGSFALVVAVCPVSRGTPGKSTFPTFPYFSPPPGGG